MPVVRPPPVSAVVVLAFRPVGVVCARVRMPLRRRANIAFTAWRFAALLLVRWRGFWWASNIALRPGRRSRS